jgi:hypothetical protein
VSTKAGSINGLTMELFVGEPNDPKSLSTSTGIHMVVHNKSTQVYFIDGFTIGTGTLTNVAIRRSFSSHLAKPYSECVNDIETNPSVFTQATLALNYRHVSMFYYIRYRGKLFRFEIS